MLSTTRYQARRHPVGALLTILALGPFIATFVLLYVLVAILVETLRFLGGRT